MTTFELLAVASAAGSICLSLFAVVCALNRIAAALERRH